MRKTTGKTRRQMLYGIPLVFGETAQFFRECPIPLVRSDALEGAAQLREPRPDRARRHFIAQARQPLVDGGAHGCETQQLRHALLLHLLDEVAHSDSGDACEARLFGIDVRRDAKIHRKRRMSTAQIRLRLPRAAYRLGQQAE
jgi:hypothetical protein